MSNDIREITETILPTLEYAAGLISIVNPNIAVAASTIILPLRYYLASCSKVELDEVKYFLSELRIRIEAIENNQNFYAFLQTDQGEHLLLKAIKSATKLRGKTKIKIIIELLLGHKARPEGMEYQTEDYIDLIQDINEFELNLLFTAWRLYQSKENILKPRENSVTSPSIPKWTDLLNKFPNTNPLEIVSVFNRLQSTGLVIREQGYFDDDGNTFGFTPLFIKLNEAILSDNF